MPLTLGVHWRGPETTRITSTSNPLVPPSSATNSSVFCASQTVAPNVGQMPADTLYEYTEPLGASPVREKTSTGGRHEPLAENRTVCQRRYRPPDSAMKKTLIEVGRATIAALVMLPNPPPNTCPTSPHAEAVRKRLNTFPLPLVTGPKLFAMLWYRTLLRMASICSSRVARLSST